MASRLVGGTRDSVREIAAAAGFADQSYFDRRFKLKFGAAPRAYRTMHARRNQDRVSDLSISSLSGLLSAVQFSECAP